MTQDYKYDVGLNKINTMLEALEKNPNATQEEVNKAKKDYELITKIKNYSEETLSPFAERFNSLMNNVVKDSVTPIEEEKVEKLPVLSVVSPKSKKINKVGLKKVVASAIVIGAIVGASGCTLVSCNNKQNEATKIEVARIEPIPSELPIATPTPSLEKILPEDWAFDPNDNSELVNRMAAFIYDAVGKGIPVKDVMTEDEIELANSKEESLVTIEQLMDFYMVMNIEEIDPADYIRLGYTTKTKETIVDNYSYCARVFATDSLTAKDDTTIDYSKIIADKESSEALQKFVDYLAKYNSSDSKKSVASEITEYITSNYIDRDANVYSMSVNEFTYRLMFDADLISNNTIIPKDMNIILNEDGKLGCADSSTKNDDGIKDKTERAEEYTSLSNAVEQKLEISREFYTQDLSNVSIDEQKTGLELEKEIKKLVISMNVRYNANEKFTMSNVSTSKGTAKTSTTTVTPSTSFKDASGKTVNVANSELQRYGVNPNDPNAQTQYESAKKAEFEKEAEANKVYKDTAGQVVDRAVADSYVKQGAIDYNNGVNNVSSVPTLYQESYKLGWNNAKAADEEAKRNLPQPGTTYVPTDNGGSTVIEENIIEQPYTGEIVIPETPADPGIGSAVIVDEVIEEIPYVEEPTPVEEPVIIEEFVPVTESVVETTEEINYTASIKRLEQLKQELFDLSSIYTDEQTHQKC